MTIYASVKKRQNMWNAAAFYVQKVSNEMSLLSCLLSLEKDGDKLG